MEVCEPYELRKTELSEENNEDILMQVCVPYELRRTGEDEEIYQEIPALADVTGEDYI